jgi:hypothetical protein
LYSKIVCGFFPAQSFQRINHILQRLIHDYDDVMLVGCATLSFVILSKNENALCRNGCTQSIPHLRLWVCIALCQSLKVRLIFDIFKYKVTKVNQKTWLLFLFSIY